jgi:hypothetical protein
VGASSLIARADATRAASSGATVVKRAAVVVVAAVIGVLLIEVALRVVGWPAPGLYVNGRGPVPLASPGATGGAYPPDTTGRLRHYDYDVDWTVNGEGFRERPRQPKSSGERRIGILGDSFAAGVGVERVRRFGDVWYQNAPQPGTTLWNLAAPICGTACEAAILEGIGAKYELDEIILAFYSGNDLSDNLEWYQAEEGSDSGQRGHLDRARAFIREHSRVATFAWVHLLRSFARITQPGVYSAPSLESSWPSTEIALDRLKDVAGLRPLHIWYIPSIPEWDDRVWSEIRDRYSFRDDGRSVVRAAVAKWADRHGVDFVDTSTWLRGCSASTCTFPVDGHWNTEGHRRVADGLAGLTKPR